MNIGGIVKNSFIDFPKKISCVIFTNGCNMNCWYCHNKHLWDSGQSKITEDEVLIFLKEHKSFLDAVVISGGEPTLQSDLIDFIRKIKTLGYLVKLDTNGTNFSVVKELIEEKLIDYIAMDIKAPFETYKKITDNYNLESIKKCVEEIKKGNIEYEFRTTFSPDLTLQDIEDISKYIAGAKNYAIQQYSANELLKSEPCFALKKNLAPLSEEILTKAKQIAQKYVNNVVLRNI